MQYMYHPGHQGEVAASLRVEPVEFYLLHLGQDVPGEGALLGEQGGEGGEGGEEGQGGGGQVEEGGEG